MRKSHANLSGQRIGMLTVVGYHMKKGGHHYWLCKCDCGNFASVQDSNLMSMSCWHCGCMKNKKRRESLLKPSAVTLTASQLPSLLPTGSLCKPQESAPPERTATSEFMSCTVFPCNNIVYWVVIFVHRSFWVFVHRQCSFMNR